MSLFIRSDDILPIHPSRTATWVSIDTTKQYFQCCIVTLLVFDIVITMDREVKYFWGSAFSDVKFAYFTNRYVGVLGACAYLFSNSFGINLPECVFSAWMQDIANWATIVLVDYILTIRVLALFHQDKTLSIILKTTLAMEACLKLSLFIFFDVTAGYVLGRLETGPTVCGQLNYLPVTWGLVDWIFPMVYNLLLMILAVYKAAEYWRLSAGFKGFVLVKVLIRDQIMYFALVVACCVIDILQFKVQVSSLFLTGVLGALGSPSLLCVLGTRMLFNLKEAGELGVNKGTNYRTPSSTVSAMQFSQSDSGGTFTIEGGSRRDTTISLPSLTS